MTVQLAFTMKEEQIKDTSLNPAEEVDLFFFLGLEINCFFFFFNPSIRKAPDFYPLSDNHL